MLSGLKYKAKVTKIVVPELMLQTPPKPEKVIAKTADFILTGYLEKIYVDEDYNLIDGYCSYLIAKTLGVKKVKIIMVKERY